MQKSFVLILILLLLSANITFARNKSNEKIPAMAKLLSLREQMNPRSRRLVTNIEVFRPQQIAFYLTR